MSTTSPSPALCLIHRYFFYCLCSFPEAMGYRHSVTGYCQSLFSRDSPCHSHAVARSPLFLANNYGKGSQGKSGKAAKLPAGIPVIRYTRRRSLREQATAGTDSGGASKASPPLSSTSLMTSYLRAVSASLWGRMSSGATRTTAASFKEVPDKGGAFKSVGHITIRRAVPALQTCLCTRLRQGMANLDSM